MLLCLCLCTCSEPKGFAFVEFKTERDANDARAGLDGVRIDGREVRVVFAQERRKTTDQMRDREKYEDCSVTAHCYFPFSGGSRSITCCRQQGEKEQPLALCVPRP